MKKAGVIIINFNGKKDTQECLQSLSKVEQKTCEVFPIVVDNDSHEPFSESDSNIKNLKVILSKKNLGFTGGNNIGITYALQQDMDYIMLLNNDTYVDKKIVGNLVKIIDSNPHIGIVSPKIYFAPNFEFHKDRYKKDEKGKVFWYAGGIMDWNNVIGKHRGVDEVDHGQYDTAGVTDFATGCCFLTTREVIEKVGMFDEKYFLYYEESDLCERIKRAGYDVWYAPDAVVWHKNAQSAGGSGSTLQDYYITRNRMLFGMKYAPVRAKIALMKESISLLKNGREWQKKGIQDFYARKFGKGSYQV